MLLICTGTRRNVRWVAAAQVTARSPPMLTGWWIFETQRQWQSLQKCEHLRSRSELRKGTGSGSTGESWVWGWCWQGQELELALTRGEFGRKKIDGRTRCNTRIRLGLKCSRDDAVCAPPASMYVDRVENIYNSAAVTQKVGTLQERKAQTNASGCVGGSWV
jgi:hypothetical protein